MQPNSTMISQPLAYLRFTQMRQGRNERNDIEPGQPPDDLRIDDSNEYPMGHHDQVEATDQLDHPQDATYLTYLDALRELIGFDCDETRDGKIDNYLSMSCFAARGHYPEETFLD